jgi:L-aspartate oxidase
LYDILILGAGISGLSAAIKAAEHGHSVLILTKGAKPDGSSNYAQGGICAVTDPKDSFKLHIEDTCEAGAGLCKKDAVKILVENGPKTIAQLVQWGVNFTPAESSEANLHFDLHLEGGHSHKRILHAADLTGKEMMRALIAKLHEFPQITFLENCLIEDLVVKGTGAARRCLGAKVIHQTTGKTEAIFAKSTILATGGAGRLWLHTIDPPDACGDGIAIAARAGAAIQDVEFMQFHPTSLYAPKLKKAFLISEAVRGFGGILKNAKGEEFMNGVHPLRSLAPRDIVARAIHREMERTGQPSMFLDVTGRKPKDIRTHFPNIYAKCLSVGIDMTKDWIPVVPAAHYMCGGVLVDTWSRTEIKGLYASGEVAATGVHGANRLASNSLLESVVFALRAVDSIEKSQILKTTFTAPKIAMEDVLMTDGEHWKRRFLEMKKIMWEKCGIVRSVAGLNAGLAKLREFNREAETAMKKNGPKTAALLAFRNAVESSILVVKSALARKESRGLQSILDYPETSAKIVHHSFYLTQPFEKN